MIQFERGTKGMVHGVCQSSELQKACSRSQVDKVKNLRGGCSFQYNVVLLFVYVRV